MKMNFDPCVRRTELGLRCRPGRKGRTHLLPQRKVKREGPGSFPKLEKQVLFSVLNINSKCQNEYPVFRLHLSATGKSGLVPAVKSI